MESAAQITGNGEGSSRPQHVGIIMDGNGRWAVARGLPRTVGHKRGAEALRNILDSCNDLGISYLTIYAFSSENWKRPEMEVSDLMALLRHYLAKEIRTLHGRGAKLRIIGDRSRLAEDIRRQIEKAEELTAGNSGLGLNVALSYGGRQEIVRAVRKLVGDAVEGKLSPQDITEQQLATCLDTRDIPDPDLIIRTGGEQRLSNFLLWQSAYAELWFTPVLWPDFTPELLNSALDDYAKRERRYGTAG